jgi:hypothetical protein
MVPKLTLQGVDVRDDVSIVPLFQYKAVQNFFWRSLNFESFLGG